MAGRGSRIRVSDLVGYWKSDGFTPERLADEFSWVPRAAVYAAFAYYFDNVDEVEAEYAEDAAFAEEFKRLYPDRVRTLSD